AIKLYRTRTPESRTVDEHPQLKSDFDCRAEIFFQMPASVLRGVDIGIDPVPLDPRWRLHSQRRRAPRPTPPQDTRTEIAGLDRRVCAGSVRARASRTRRAQWPFARQSGQSRGGARVTVAAFAEEEQMPGAQYKR